MKRCGGGQGGGARRSKCEMFCSIVRKNLKNSDDWLCWTRQMWRWKMKAEACRRVEKWSKVEQEYEMFCIVR